MILVVTCYIAAKNLKEKELTYAAMTIRPCAYISTDEYTMSQSGHKATDARTLEPCTNTYATCQIIKTHPDARRELAGLQAQAKT
jgi:hypothetical protein